MNRRSPAESASFAGYRFPPEVILLAVRWYLRYGLSYRDVEELLAERGADAIEQPVRQHNGEEGVGFRLENIVLGAAVADATEYVENAPKDMVTALPGQVTRIKATFDKPGRYVWHCHILSHEDHEMMRVLQVGD